MILLSSGSGLDVFNSYGFLLLLSLIIILSYIFNLVSAHTRIPSVLMLIGLGIGLQYIARSMHMETPDLAFALEVLGQVGVIMIVLEAALELEIKREKLPLIGRAFLAAAIGLVGSAFAISFALYYIINLNQSTEVISHLTSMIYATPLAVMSSAIIIPSVGSLVEKRKEFMVYESTFSDILGIMMFYFLITVAGTGEVESTTYGFIGGALLTIVASIIISYILVIIFQKIETHVKLFLLIAVLMVFYYTAKLFHLSPLWIILIFGLILANDRLFFIGPLRRFVNPKRVREIDRDFTVLTMETAFVVRTFFFVVFGFTLQLATLAEGQVWLISGIVIVLLYTVRLITLKLTRWRDFIPELWIAPRGLITILLFFGIPSSVAIGDELFSPGILLTTILISSAIMTWSLITWKEAHPEDVVGPAIAEALEGDPLLGGVNPNTDFVTASEAPEKMAEKSTEEPAKSAEEKSESSAEESKDTPEDKKEEDLNAPRPGWDGSDG
ncbi:MAG: cell volume regulation protein A [Limisphaerales bacterium]|jgi:cell volume regulation protein A